MKQSLQKILILLTFYLGTGHLLAEEFTLEARTAAMQTELGQALLQPQFNPRLRRTNVASLLKSPGAHSPVCRQLAVYLAGGVDRVVRYTERDADMLRDSDLVAVLEDMNRYGADVLDFPFPRSVGRPQGFPRTCAELILN